MHRGRLASGRGPSALATTIDDQQRQQQQQQQHAQRGQQQHGDKSSARRQLQDEAGMSTVTIAIVLTVLVGAAGYLVQALTARRAERAAADQAQQLHVSEATMDREHEQMVAQIHRTDKWLE